MLTLLIALVTATVRAGCEPPPPNHPKAPIGARAPALGAAVLEVPLLGAMPEPKEIISTLNDRGIPATLMVSADWAERHGEFIQEAAEAGHEIGLWVSIRDDIGLSGAYAHDPDFSDWVDAIRRARKTVKKASGVQPKTIGMATLTPLGEMAIDALAFKAVLPTERTVQDQPRRVSRTDEAKGRARVIGQGRYTDGCGHILPHWSPAALDRATHTAARAEWVRIGLPSADGVSGMLGQWLDEVVIAEKWPVVTARKMAKLAVKAEDRPPKPPPSIAVAKRITPEALRRAAENLAGDGRLPRRATEDLNLTETYIGLVTLVAAETPPGPVTLGHLSGPTSCARTEIDGPTLLTKTEIISLARQLHARLRGQVPALVSVGEHELTAAEALRVLARAHIGAKLLADHVDNPQPFALDCGWGSSKGL